MNKSRAKREQKEIDKLFSGGRYWQWLEKVQETGLRDHYKKQWDDVWQTLAKQALRHPERLQEFWSNCTAIKTPPDIADVKLLFGVRGFIYDDTPVEHLMNIRGLSMPAEELRKRAMTYKDDSLTQNKIGKLLESFCNTPEKIVKRHFVSLAQLLSGTNLAQDIEALGQHIVYINRIGTKTGTNVKREKLSVIDEYLSDIHEDIHSELGQILFYPFTVNLSGYLSTLAQGGNTVAVANCVADMPFLFSLSAGQKADQIRDGIANLNTDVLNNEYIEKKISEADLQGKIALIRKLRHLIMDATYSSGVKRYAVHLRTLYREILSEISRLQQTISEREKRAVSNVMGREIVHDLHYLWETHRDLAELLMLTGQTGCMNTRLAGLAMVMSDISKSRRLMELSQEVLRRYHTDFGEELQWLFKDFESMVFPGVSSLKPLINLFGEQEGFNEKLHALVKERLQRALILGTISQERFGIPEFFTRMFDIRDSMGQLKSVRMELAQMNNYKPFFHLSEYLDCFPDDEYSEKGFKRLFGKVYDNSAIKGVIITFEALVEKQQATAFHYRDDSMRHILAMQSGAFLELIKEHWDDLATVGIDTLKRLSDIIIARFSSDSILIKFYNLLEVRHNAGETGLEPLQTKISSALRKIADSKAAKLTRTTKTKRRKR
ncbi:hypothetical protein MBAV_002386 [Candidatus Magnetobacterium bavaricum]|uniref:Uncharacterized protein n=1 Tax=Candidatus Magnetobacterium bavaricum TaxID=29290 RepID=A0A0F3GTZ0_9BACT|nr:hypothetical protein MBAV_002386 [Candidatus Magnetobacterium bavaricum]